MKIKKLTIPAVQYRTATFDKSAINEEARTVEMSIASDAPYQRYFGAEILDHGNASVRMDRLKAGAPLLFNHDRNMHIGRIIEAKSDGKNLRVKAQFGNSALAQEKFKDVCDGILRETSVGYQVNRMVLEVEDEEKGDTYRVTDWTPYEGSLVTIPADASVGVGRSDDSSTKEIIVETKNAIDDNANSDNNANKQNKAMEKTAEQIAADNAKLQAKIEVMEAADNKRQRCEKIDAFLRQQAQRHPDWSKLVEPIAAKHKAGDADFESFRMEALDVHPALTRTNDQSPELGMSKKEVQQFSLTRAINCVAKKTRGYEMEVSDTVAKQCGRDTQGFFIPHDVMIHRDEEAMLKRYLAANVFTGAGAFIESSAQGQTLIELLRNNMMVMKMGARHLTGLVGNLAIPSQTGGATASWLSEDATITASQQTVGQVALTPHRVAGLTAFTFQLLAQSQTVDVENFVRQDLMQVIAIAKDLAALSGTGVSGQPLGIKNTANLSTSVTLAGANSMVYAQAVQFETNVATNNALMGKCGYLASVAARGNSKLVAEISAANSIPVWKDDRVNGYPAYATTQLTTLPSVVFGNWDDLIIADWGPGGNEVIVDPYSLAAQGQVRVIIQHMTDVAIRHGKSFSISTT